MATYRQKVPTIQAEPWSPDSQDPEVPLLTQLQVNRVAPGSDLEDTDPDCGFTWAEHGWSGSEWDGRLTHPGDYKVTQYGSTWTQAKNEFESRWEL